MNIAEAKEKAANLTEHGISLTRQEMRQTIAVLRDEVNGLESEVERLRLSGICSRRKRWRWQRMR